MIALNLQHIVVHHSKTSSGDIVSMTQDYVHRGFPRQMYFKLFLNGCLRGERYEPSFDGVGVPGKGWDMDNYFVSEKDYMVLAELNGGLKNAAAICIVGSIFEEYTFKQLLGVVLECRSLVGRFGLDVGAILGHYECPESSRDINCPDMDMGMFRSAVSGGIEINHEPTLMEALKPKR